MFCGNEKKWQGHFGVAGVKRPLVINKLVEPSLKSSKCEEMDEG